MSFAEVAYPYAGPLHGPQRYKIRAQLMILGVSPASKVQACSLARPPIALPDFIGLA